MGTFVYNIAKGRVNSYAALAQAGTGGAVLRAIPLEATGLEADATLKDYDNLSLLLAGTTNEQTTMGRKVLTSPTVVTDDTGDTNSADTADITWTAATGNAVGAITIVFDPTGSSADTALIPLTNHVWALTPDGSDATATVTNFFQAS